MKIHDTRQTVDYQSIKLGEAFIYERTLYLKGADILCTPEKPIYYAIDLKNGNVLTVTPGTMVMPVRVEVMVYHIEGA